MKPQYRRDKITDKVSAGIGDFPKRSAIPKRRKKPRRVSVVRDQKYMNWLKDNLCVACHVEFSLAEPGTFPARRLLRDIDPAHTDKTNGMRSKGADSSCIPLCRTHHLEMDGHLNTCIVTKEQFARKYGLDLAAIAAEHYARFKGESAC